MAMPRSKIESILIPLRVPEKMELPIRFSAGKKMTRDRFLEFCRINDDLRIERTSEGEIEIMPPAFWDTGFRNAELTTQIGTWATQEASGVAVDSSAGYELPNGATRSPDASWVDRARLAALRPEDKRGFLPLCPDFVVELRSSSDRLKKLKEKMEEYIANGAKLGWLIDPIERKVYIYRPGSEVEVLDNPATLIGDPVLPGFTLDLGKIWEPDL